MRISILGAGVPTPTPERFGTSYVVHYGADSLLFDCGPATTYKLARMGIPSVSIGHLFFTHHHFDHDADYPCFLLTRWDQSTGSEPVLQVFGPPPTALLTRRILDPDEGAFAHDWKARVNHPSSQKVYELRGGTLPRRPPVVHAFDVGVGVVCRQGPWEVTAATTIHVQPWLESLAYKISGGEGSLVVTGDTIPCQSVIDLATGADAMVCMCWDRQERMDRSSLSDSVCGTVGAAEMARAAQVSTLILVHMSGVLSAPGEMERALAEVGAIFAGRIVWARELMTIDLSS